VRLPVRAALAATVRAVPRATAVSVVALALLWEFAGAGSVAAAQGVPTAGSAANSSPSKPSAPVGTAAMAIPPSPTRWVTDTAGFLSPQTAEQLDEELRQVQATSGHQVLVWIAPSAGGDTIEDFAVRAFKAWRVGRKGLDDGLALFVLADDRTVRFEVGYGLEGQLPDAIAARILNEIVLPRLHAGDRDGAITQGIAAALATIDGKPWSEVAASATVAAGGGAGSGAGVAVPSTDDDAAAAQAAAEARRRAAQPPSLIGTIVKWVLIAIVLLIFITHPSFAFWLLMSIFSGGSGGGGGGGGGGGFSGGGGSSGGGGASGSW
jgi:uncharacterized protein